MVSPDAVCVKREARAIARLRWQEGGDGFARRGSSRGARGRRKGTVSPDVVRATVARRRARRSLAVSRQYRTVSRVRAGVGSARKNAVAMARRDGSPRGRPRVALRTVPRSTPIAVLCFRWGLVRRGPRRRRRAIPAARVGDRHEDDDDDERRGRDGDDRARARRRAARGAHLRARRADVVAAHDDRRERVRVSSLRSRRPRSPPPVAPSAPPPVVCGGGSGGSGGVTSSPPFCFSRVRRTRAPPHACARVFV